ncbi:hypothetical protein R1flu_005420 [Riccia fluitans]|uniref:Uncharacterized protein n=1 Tax=Riccia fluitans TaxID=41844 RepID=A0ABD1YT52_9MARC
MNSSASYWPGMLLSKDIVLMQLVAISERFSCLLCADVEKGTVADWADASSNVFVILIDSAQNYEKDSKL